MIKNYMYSDAAGTDVTATDTNGYIVFSGGTSNLIQNIKTSDILEVGNFALVAATVNFEQDVTVAGTPAEGDIVTITIQSKDSRQNRRDVYKVYVHSGDTVTSIDAALAAQINADDSVASATSALGVVSIAATAQVIVTAGAEGASTVSEGAVTPFESITSPAFYAEKDSVVLGADASYAALYIKVRKFQDQTYIAGGFAGDIIAVYAPTSEVDAIEIVINAAL
jgi:hypothetical protein